MSEEQTTYDLNGTAVLAARLNTMTVRMAELEERIDRLIVGQRELREQRSGDVLERIAVAVEYIAADVQSYVDRRP